MTAQEDFDAKYITSTEICRELGVTRASVGLARDRGDLPEPVRITRPNGDTHVMIWLRAEAAPMLEVWREKLNTTGKATRDANAREVMTNYHASKNVA